MLAQINELNASLDRSDELVNLANLKLAQVKRHIAMNRRELVIGPAQPGREPADDRKAARESLHDGLDLDARGDPRRAEPRRDHSADRHRATGSRRSTRRSRPRWRCSGRGADATARSSSTESAQVQQLVAQRAQQRQAIEMRLGERRALLSSLNGEVQRLLAEQQAAQARAARAAQAQVPPHRPSRRRPSPPRRSARPPRRPRARPSCRRRATAASSASRCRSSGRRTSGPAPRPAASTARGSSCTRTRRSASRCRIPRTRCGTTATSVPRDQLQPGDIVFFDGLGHVGIYIGGGEFVHAPHTGTVVQVSSLDSDGSYDGARRIVG